MLGEAPRTSQGLDNGGAPESGRLWGDDHEGYPC